MIATNGIAEYFRLQLLPAIEELPKPSPRPKIEGILSRYTQLFEEPRGLPPIRATDHHIRPYRYPHFQKHEIECQIKEMMAEGIIQ